VVRAFATQGDACLVHLHNVSGGLLGGDQLKQEVRLGAGSRVQLTTTGATRIYRHREHFVPTQQHTEMFLGEGALLEYVPDPTIPFAGSRYQQHTSIHLARDAGLFWWEILTPGREARGEIFDYDQLQISTRISASGRLIAAENISLQPRTKNVSSTARLGPFQYAVTFYVCCAGLQPACWHALEESLRRLLTDLAKPRDTLWGVSPLVVDGLVIRCLAHSGRDILSGLHSIWAHAKRQIYNLEAIPPRKVY
jgi:urease accessory protein